DASPRGQGRAMAGGDRDVLRDGVLLRLCLINIAMVSAGIALIGALVPAYLKTHAATPEYAIRASYPLNTITRPVAQIPPPSFVEGRRRMPLLALGAALWAAAWVLLFVAATTLRGVDTIVIAAPAIVLYGLGESLYALIVTPTAASLAPDTLRGRYLAM